VCSLRHNTLVWFYSVLFIYTTYFGRRKLIFSKYLLLLLPNDSPHGRNMLYIIQSFRSLSYDRSTASSLHTERYNASYFNFQYPLVSLRSSTSRLRFLPHLPVTSIFPAIAWFRRQFLRKMTTLQLVSFFYCMWDIPVHLVSMYVLSINNT
jgi:hypothetical protein